MTMTVSDETHTYTAPGKPVVIEYPGKLSKEGMGHLRKAASEAFNVPESRVLILDGGATLSPVAGLYAPKGNG